MRVPLGPTNGRPAGKRDGRGKCWSELKPRGSGEGQQGFKAWSLFLGLAPMGTSNASANKSTS